MARLLAVLTVALWLLAAVPGAFAQGCPQQQINAQTGTTYTVLNTDNCKLVSLSNGSAVAVTLPQAGASGNFGNTWSATFVNIGAGAVTITPTTSTIDGLASWTLQRYQGVRVTSNGTNYVSSGLPANYSTGLTYSAGALAVSYGTSSGTAVQGNDSRVTAGLNSSLAVPICPNGIGCLTTATPDIYPIGFAASIANATVPVALCKVSPAATVTFLVKKWTAGNPATSSTLCTGSISTSCAVSACSISTTSLNAADGLSIEGTQASPDAAAVISVTVPFVKQ